MLLMCIFCARKPHKSIFHKQINKPNEFDIMLKLKVPRVTLSALEDYDGLFYTIKLYKSTRLNVQHFVLEDGRTISASKIKKEMHRLVRKFISNYKGVLNKSALS